MPVFKEASITDVPKVLEMMADFYAIDSYAFERERSKTLLERLIREPQLGKLWVIDHRERRAGYVLLVFSFSLEYGGLVGIIDELYLREEFRNRGIGGKAMAFVEAQAKALGVTTLFLEVENHNTAGKKLYARQGFLGKERTLLRKELE